MVKESEVVNQKLSGKETIAEAVELLKKSYDTQTVVSMLKRGEYDVLYRQGRREVQSEQRKATKARIGLLEQEMKRLNPKVLEEIENKLKAKK